MSRSALRPFEDTEFCSFGKLLLTFVKINFENAK